MNLKEILEKVNENEENFKTLYDMTIDRVFSYVSLRTRDRTKAKEITQDVFLSLWKSLPKFKYISDNHFYSFLFTVVRREIIRARKEKYENVSIEEAYEISAPEEEKEDYRFLLQRITCLKEKERMVVELRYFEDLDFQRISETLNISLSNAKVIHHRAIKKLKYLLPGYE